MFKLSWKHLSPSLTNEIKWNAWSVLTLWEIKVAINLSSHKLTSLSLYPWLIAWSALKIRFLKLNKSACRFCSRSALSNVFSCILVSPFMIRFVKRLSNPMRSMKFVIASELRRLFYRSNLVSYLNFNCEELMPFWGVGVLFWVGRESLVEIFHWNPSDFIDHFVFKQLKRTYFNWSRRLEMLHVR